MGGEEEQEEEFGGAILKNKIKEILCGDLTAQQPELSMAFARDETTRPLGKGCSSVLEHLHCMPKVPSSNLCLSR